MSGLTREVVEKVWALSDADGDGSLTVEEFHAGLNKHRATIGEAPIPFDTVKVWFGGIDHSKDGKVSKQEYITELLERGNREEGLKRAFAKEAGADGIIDKNELRKLFVRLNFCKPEHVDFFTDYIFQNADKDGSGGLSFDEFKAAMDKY